MQPVACAADCATTGANRTARPGFDPPGDLGLVASEPGGDTRPEPLQPPRTARAHANSAAQSTAERHFTSLAADQSEHMIELLELWPAAHSFF